MLRLRWKTDGCDQFRDRNMDTLTGILSGCDQLNELIAICTIILRVNGTAIDLILCLTLSANIIMQNEQ